MAFGKKEKEKETITAAAEESGEFFVKEKDGGSLTFHLKGKVDKEKTPHILEAAKDGLLSEDVKSFVFDMKDVTYISRQGLEMFSSISQMAVERDIKYRLTNTKPEFIKLFRLTGEASAFDVEAEN